MALFAVAESFSDGITSITTIIIATLGWRLTYIIIGTVFIGIGLVAISVIKEPVR